MNFVALPLVALREGGRTEEAFATENEGKCIYAHHFPVPSGLLYYPITH